MGEDVSFAELVTLLFNWFVQHEECFRIEQALPSLINHERKWQSRPCAQGPTAVLEALVVVVCRDVIREYTLRFNGHGVGLIGEDIFFHGVSLDDFVALCSSDALQTKLREMILVDLANRLT